MNEPAFPRHSVVCCIVLLSSLHVVGQQRDTAMFTPGVKMSPDDRYLAFFAGPRPPNGRAPLPEWSRLFVADLDTKDVVCYRDFAPASFALGWQTTGMAALYAVEDLSAKTGEYRTRLVRFSPSTGGSPVVVREFDQASKPLAAFDVSFLEWSPDGHILAVGGLLSELHLSFDGGKLFVPMDATGHVLRAVWVDSATLLAEKWAGGNNIRIVEVKLDDQGGDSANTVAEGLRMLVCGALGGEGVYRGEHDVQVGKERVLHSEYPLGPVLADNGYVVTSLRLPDGRTEILVFDEQRRAVDKRSFPGAPSPIGISARRGSVYLAEKEPLQIRCYGFREGDSSTTVLKIPEVTWPGQDETPGMGSSRTERHTGD